MEKYLTGSNQFSECTFNSSEFIIDEPYYFEYFGDINKIIQAQCGGDSTIVFEEKYGEKYINETNNGETNEIWKMNNV